MTPRTNHSLSSQESFSDFLLEQMKYSGSEFDFRLSENVIQLLPPPVLKHKWQHDLETPVFTYPGYELSYFADSKEARKVRDDLTIVPGRVHQFWRFKSEQPDEILFDFSPLGCVLFSKNQSGLGSTGQHQKYLSSWLSYAASPELWGPEGKWTRFHRRLHSLFEKNQLLKGSDLPGFYPLKLSALGVKELPILGEEKEDTLNLYLPWHFPLSSLEKLEKLMRQEH